MKHPNIDSEQPRLTIVPYLVPQEEYDTYFNPNGYSINIKIWKILIPILLIVIFLFLKNKNK